MLKAKTIVLGVMALGAVAMIGETGFAAPVGNANGTRTERRGQKGERGQKATPQQRVERMARALNLSDNQKSRIVAILQDAKNQMQSQRGNKNLTREQKQERRRAMREQTKNRINAVLTPQQRDKMAQMQERRRQRREQNGDAPNRGQRRPVQ